ncbi:MAG: hypothetical protein ACLUHA_13310 [Bacteroides stercoris]
MASYRLIDEDGGFGKQLNRFTSSCSAAVCESEEDDTRKCVKKSFRK